MAIKSLSNTGIQTGQTVQASQVSQSINAFTATDDYRIKVSGSFIVTGSLITHGPASTTNFVKFPNVATKLATGSVGVVGVDSAGNLYSASISSGTKGQKGDTGTKGSAGTKGTAGSKGQKGEGGTKGSVGPQGNQGPKGSQGDQGAGGTKGPAGTKGSTGGQGNAGTKGSAGPAGPTGGAGPKGANGPKGAQGAQGNQGAAGPKGSIGPTGNTGPQGAGGSKGQKGADSSVAGPKGQKGQSGTGNAGSKGQKGQTGTKGADSSVAGPAGPKGAEGPQGNAGTKGQKGQTGADSTVAGPAGPKGSTGTKGADSSVAGPKGQKGADSAVAGPKGQKGDNSSVAGPKGTTGTKGSLGPKGTTGTKGSEGAGGGSGISFNNQVRYNVFNGTDVKLTLMSTGNYMGGTTWARSAGEVTFTSAAHGLSTGDVAYFRNVGDSNYNSCAITFVDANSFKAQGFTNSGDTSGTEAAYIPAFSASLTLNGTDSVTAITITSPGGISGSAQLNAMQLYAAGQGDDIAITFPVNEENGSGFKSAAFQGINSMLFAAQKDSGGGTYTTLITPAVKYNRASNSNIATITNVGEFAPMVIKGYTL